MSVRYFDLIREMKRGLHWTLVSGMFAAEKLPQVDVDSPRERVECKLQTTRVSHIEVQIGLRTDIQPSSEAVVLVD